MTIEKHTTIPLDLDYVALVGQAMYAYAYYEWTIIYTTQHLQPSMEFVKSYCRDHEIYTSSSVLKKFRQAHENPEITLNTQQRKDLKECAEDFKELIDFRNALAHGHPVTDVNGEQVLSYHANVQRNITDLKWTNDEVIEFIKNIDGKQKMASKAHGSVKS